MEITICSKVIEKYAKACFDAPSFRIINLIKGNTDIEICLDQKGNAIKAYETLSKNPWVDASILKEFLKRLEYIISSDKQVVILNNVDWDSADERELYTKIASLSSKQLITTVKAHYNWYESWNKILSEGEGEKILTRWPGAFIANINNVNTIN